jgi:hypothetical protein
MGRDGYHRSLLLWSRHPRSPLCQLCLLLCSGCWLAYTHQSTLAEVILPPLVLERALNYEPMMINLYTATHPHPPIYIITRDAQSMEDNHCQTPRHSYVDLATNTPALSRAFSPPVALTEPPVLHWPNQHHPLNHFLYPLWSHLGIGLRPPLSTHQSKQKQLSLDHGWVCLPRLSWLYSPLACMPPGAPPPLVNPQRILGPAFANVMGLVTAPLHRSDPSLALITTTQGHQKASTELLICCLLLVHHDPNLLALLLGQSAGGSAAIIPRQLVSTPDYQTLQS